jgi:hypothetical protein
MGGILRPVLVELVWDSHFPQSDVAGKSVADLSFVLLRDSKCQQLPVGMVRRGRPRQTFGEIAFSLPDGRNPKPWAS